MIKMGLIDFLHFSNLIQQKAFFHTKNKDHKNESIFYDFSIEIHPVEDPFNKKYFKWSKVNFL